MARPRTIQPEDIVSGSTQVQIAEKTGVSQAAISKSRYLVRNNQDEIDFEATLAGLNALQRAQVRKENYLADQHQLKSLEQQGKLVEIDAVKDLWASTAQTLRDHLMSISDRIAPELAALTDARMVRDRLLDEIKLVLKNLPDNLHESEHKGEETGDS